MMQSITLQTSDTIVTSGDKLGQLQFAASAESDGSAAIAVAGSVYVQAEGSFSSSSNPTSLVLATASADASAAVGRIKVTDNGHLVPMANNSYDLGGSDLNFRNLYVQNIESETLTVDTNTLYIDAANNRVGIGTTSPAYQVEIEKTGTNALLVLDRTDGAACFIEGQASRSAFGSVGATPLALAYNSAAVVLIGANGAITVNPDGDGFTFPTTDGSANQVLQTDGNGSLSFATVSTGGSYTAGSGLTLVGTEFNIYGGSGHFHEIIFNSGEQSSTYSRDGIRILTEPNPLNSSSNFANIKIGAGLDLYTATGDILYDANIFMGYNIASGLDNTGYPYKPYSNIFVGSRISQNCEFVAGNVGIGNGVFLNCRYVTSSVGIGGNSFENTDTVTNSVAFNGAGVGIDEIKDSFLWGGLCTNNATIIKDTIGLGFAALFNASGQHNVSLGYAAGYGMKGNNNVSIDQNTAVSTVIGTNSNKINLCQVIVGDHSSKLLAIGNVGSADITPDATLEIKPKTATDVGLIVQAATSHSASLQEWQNSSETKLLAVGPDGGVELPSNVPSTTTNKLYNDGGTLKFNGSSIGSSYTAGSGLTLIGTEFNVYGGSGHFINLDVDGAFTAVTKSFLIDHPSKEGMKLQYASLEGPENGVYVRGTTKETFITLPNYWRDLVHNSSITVNLTPLGQFQPLFVESKSNREIIVGGVCGYYDYVVYGERKDVAKLEVEW